MTDKHSRPEKNDIIRFDYEQSLQTYRMLADIRFKLLAFVPLISGVAIAILTTDPVHASSQLVLAGGVFGLLITLGITFYDQRNTQFMNVSRLRARELERSLSLPLEGQFPRIPPKDLEFLGRMKIWSDRGLALIYGSVLAAWVFLITRTTFDLFGLSADLIVTLLTILTFAALQLEFHRMDCRAKCSAENVISKSKSSSKGGGHMDCTDCRAKCSVKNVIRESLPKRGGQ
jgi:hypothetical protein